MILILDPENGNSGSHWTSLVLAKEPCGVKGYYANSTGAVCPQIVADVLENIQIVNIFQGMHQQIDSWNCGIFALQNMLHIRQLL